MSIVATYVVIMIARLAGQSPGGGDLRGPTKAIRLLMCPMKCAAAIVDRAVYDSHHRFLWRDRLELKVGFGTIYYMECSATTSCKGPRLGSYCSEAL